jgi:hypothetical protein
LSQAVVFVPGYAEKLIDPASFLPYFFERLFIVIGVHPWTIDPESLIVTSGGFDPKHYSYLTRSITFTHLLQFHFADLFLIFYLLIIFIILNRSLVYYSS